MKKILVPLDFSDVTERVLETTADLARDLGAKVLLVHVITPSIVMTAYGITEDQAPEALQKERERAEDEIERCRDKLASSDLDAETVIVQGSPAESIIDVAHQHNIDLVVMGSHGHGALYEFIVGSTTRGVLKRFAGPVMLVPSRLPPRERERERK